MSSHPAETAITDRIGKGFVAQIQPLTGVLAKILQRKEEAIRRCAPELPLGLVSPVLLHPLNTPVLQRI